MQSNIYREIKERGTKDFPLEYHYVDEIHPRYEMMYHWHSEFEIIHIVSGQMDLNLDGKEFTAYAGDTVFVGDRVCHGGQPKDCVYVCFVFDLRMFNSGSNIISKRMGRLLDHEIKINNYIPASLGEIKNIICDMINVVDKKMEFYEVVLYGQLYEVIGRLVGDGYYAERSAKKTTEKPSSTARGRAVMKKIVGYIEEHYAEEITLTQLAQLAEMSKKYFCTFFYDYTHRTPIDYVNCYRIECACELLHATDKPIIEVAYDTGFNDASYFTKTFKKYTGVTPFAYRQNH